MEKQPKVSVIMPVYNTGKYLRECLDSLLAQTLTDFELICVDDGSTDDSLAILQEYAENDNRITILQQNHALAGAARNLGMRHAKGEYIIFEDSDDLFHPQMLELPAAKADAANADICVFSIDGFDNQTGQKFPLPASCHPNEKQQQVFSRKDDPDHIFSFTNPSPCNKLLKREFIEKNHLEFQRIPNCNDLSFELTALASASAITTIDQALFSYRTNQPHSSQGMKDAYPLAFYDALTELRKRLQERDLYDMLEKAYINQAASTTFYHLLSAKSTIVFENIYQFCKNTLLESLNLIGRDSDYYFKTDGPDNFEMIRVIQEESMIDFALKFPCRWKQLPEYKRLNPLSIKSFLKQIYLKIRR